MNTDRQQDPRFRTLDGVLITDGLPVWDYDLCLGTVDFAETSLGSLTGMNGPHWDGWFRVKRANRAGHSLMNGARLWAQHPHTNQPAKDAYAVIIEGNAVAKFSRTDEIAFLVNVPQTVNGLRVLQISKYEPGCDGGYASATIVALRPDDATYSTHTLVAQDDAGDEIKWVLDRGHYDFRRLLDAQHDALGR